MNQLRDDEVEVLRGLIAMMKRSSFAYLDLMDQQKEWTPVRNPRTVSASANVNPLDDVILVSGNTTMTLETAVACDGRQHTFKKMDSSSTTMTLTATGAQTIDSSGSITATTQFDTITVKSDGVNWNVIGRESKFAYGISVGGATAGMGGVAFPATAVDVSDANTLDDYEEGTFTPTDGSGASLTFTGPAGQYVKVGKKALMGYTLTYPVTASGAGSNIASFPFAVAGNTQSRTGYLSYSTYGAGIYGTPSGATVNFFSLAGAQLTNLQLSAVTIIGTSDGVV